ncbi:MAG: HyaD/HybD family hydrogenase maturation endopeptidase [Desulfobacteraceae bacterium]|nr:HyaD/HybD family hydrogenase maturation endopeptidase [Desulfobacteraceae bacterium]
MSLKTTLIGLGNILMRDEGVGIHVVKYIQENFVVPPELEIVDGGTSGLDLLPFIEGRDQVLFVDTVNFNREPGYISVLLNGQIPALSGTKDCLHHMGLMDVLAAARLLDKLPAQIALIGIQPHTIATGLDLSPSIQARLQPLVDQILKQLAFWGLACRPCREF